MKAVSRIAILREQAELTQRELADLLQVTENTVANWETGRSSVEWINRVIVLCKIFDCKPEELIEYVLDSDAKEKNKKRKSLAVMRERINPRRIKNTATKHIRK